MNGLPPQATAARTDRPLPTALRVAAACTALALTAGILLGGRAPGATGWIVPPWDKAVHALAYAAIAACWSTAAGGRRVALAIALTVATGGLDEWLQRSLPGREADLTDLVADAIGAATGAWVAAIIVPRAWQRVNSMWRRPRSV